MNAPKGQELVDRYRRNYSIPAAVPVSEEMVLHHWELELALTRELLNSTPGNRRETFEVCYSRLYSELKWLNQFVDEDIAVATREEEFQRWISLIGAPLTQRIYEVGSGKAGLISFIARLGYPCTATEITSERGEKHTTSSVTWKNSDGVHLGEFEQRESYDVVISDQVIEHIHPEDTQAHFRGAYAILVPGGRYIFRVPHRFTGPHDISLVFGCDSALGMHLRELTFGEIGSLATEAGFSELAVVLLGAKRAPPRSCRGDGGLSTAGYFVAVTLVERLIGHLQPAKARRLAVRLASRLGFFPVLFVVATKGRN